MKKLSLFLIMLISVIFSASAYDYEIKWFSGVDLDYIKKAHNDVVVIGDQTFSKMYDLNGNLLSDKSYQRIYPFNYEQTLFNCITLEVFTNNVEYESDFYTVHNNPDIYNELKKYYILNNRSDELTLENVLYANVYRVCNTTGEVFYNDIIGVKMDSETEKRYNELNKIIYKPITGGMSSLWDNNGNRLSAYGNYELYEDGITIGYARLLGNNCEYVFNRSTGDLIKIDNFVIGTYQYDTGMGVIEKTKDGKYVYYDNHLKKVTNIKFDEFLGVYNSSAVFKHEGKYYGFDTEWKLAYVGENEIKAVYFDNYVIENEKGLLGLYDKNFNAVIPPEYKNIYWICENVYIADSGEEQYLYNQSEIVAKGYDFYEANEVYSVKGMSIPAQNKDKGYYCILDVKGNELISSEEFSFKTNGFDVFCDNGKGKIGRVIFKDTNPNIRINGKLLVSDTMARIKNNITLVPLRALAEKTGFLVSYNADTKEIDITNGESEIKFTIGKTEAFANGKKISLEAAPEIINNRTLVPVRAISDAFGYDISWDGERRLVEINTMEN